MRTSPAPEFAVPLNLAPGRSTRIAQSLYAVAFCLLIGLALLTRWPQFREGLWRDEAMAVYVSESHSVSDFVARSRIADYNPPLFNVLVSLWGRVAGFGEQSLKGFAFAAGLIALLAVALATRKIFGSPRAALFACLLAINNPILIGVGTELRTYSFSVVLVLLSLTLAVEAHRHEARRPQLARWALLAGALVLLVYSHVSGALVAAAFGVCGLAVATRSKGRRGGFALSITASLGLAAFSWWLPTSWSQYRVGLPYETKLSFAARWQNLMTSLPDVLPFGAAIFLLFGLVAGFEAVSGRSSAMRGAVAGSGFAVALAIVSVFAVLVPLGLFSQTRRYLALAAAILTVLAAAALDRVASACTSGSNARRIGFGLAVAALLIAGCAARIPLYREMGRFMMNGIPKSGIRTLCLERTVGDHELLIAAPDYLASTLWYYCGSEKRIRGFVRWEKPTLLNLRGYSAEWLSSDAIPRTVRALELTLRSSGSTQFFVVSDRQWDGPPLFFRKHVTSLQDALEKRYPLLEEMRYEGRMERIDLALFSALPK